MRKRETGFTLLEALIAMLILAIGMLGVAGLQALTLKNSHASFQRSVAVLQANDLVERLWANICDLVDEDGNIVTADINSIRDLWRDEYDSGDLANWNGELAILSSDGDNPLYFDITISWDDGRMNAVGADGEEFIYTAVIPVLDNCPSP